AEIKARPAVKRAAPVNLTPAYNAYLGRLRATVLKNWNVPDGNNSVVLTAIVIQDGSVSDVTVSGNPKNAAAEQAAQSALAQSQPLPPLPAGSPPAKMI